MLTATELLLLVSTPGGVLVAPAHELEEDHRPGPADREIGNLVDHRREGETRVLSPWLSQPALLASSSEVAMSARVP